MVEVTTNRRQLEMWPAWIRANPELSMLSVQRFIDEARAEGLGQIEVAQWAGEVIVIATRPGDPTGKEVFV